jgi:pimeloyl-ACP methyl ester carboxylesterase
MMFVSSATLAVALLLQPAMSNGSSTPTWETLPVEQRLSPLAKEGYVDHEGARIWYGTAGKGEPVILLHGGMESSLSRGNQVPALIKTHHEVILIDSRGHGRSTLGPYPLSYERMQSDVVAVMDTLHLKKASFVGWSDGANISLIMAMKNPERVNAVYAFGANMNTDAMVPGTFTSPILSEAATRLAKDYARISPGIESCVRPLFASNIPTPPTIEKYEDCCRFGARNSALFLGIDQQPDCVDR